jgi:hypothetical protein
MESTVLPNPELRGWRLVTEVRPLDTFMVDEGFNSQKRPDAFGQQVYFH